MTAPFLHHRIDGSGPHMLMLHPVGLDLTCFDPMVAALHDRYRILRVDLRGHGGSPVVDQSSDLGGYADDVHALVGDLEWAPTAVVGFSFGGMVAQVLALKYPRDVSALVVAACPGTLSDEGRRTMVERAVLAERGGMAAVVDVTAERWFSEPYRRRGADEPVRRRLLADDVRGWAQAWRAIAAIETAPHLGSMAVPTLCLAGEDDVAAPPPVVEAIARAIPGARFAVIPGAPHMLFIEQPREVASAIASFLEDTR